MSSETTFILSVQKSTPHPRLPFFPQDFKLSPSIFSAQLLPEEIRAKDGSCPIGLDTKPIAFLLEGIEL